MSPFPTDTRPPVKRLSEQGGTKEEGHIYTSAVDGRNVERASSSSPSVSYLRERLLSIVTTRSVPVTSGKSGEQLPVVVIAHLAVLQVTAAAATTTVSIIHGRAELRCIARAAR